MQSRRLIALAVCVLAGGCLSEKEAVKVLRKDHPRRQAAMIARIAREGKPSMAGELIRLLEAEDEGVRFMAAAALHKLTDIDRGIHFTEGEKRQAIIQRWRRWYEDEFGKPVPEAEPEPPAGKEDDGAPDEDAEDAEGRPAAETDAETPGEAETPPAEAPSKAEPAGAKEPGKDEPPAEAKPPDEDEKETGDAAPPGDETPPQAPDADEDEEGPKEYPLPKVEPPDAGSPPEKAKETAG